MSKSSIFPDLDGQSVFITGGGAGIGAYLTEGFLQQGARVTFVGRNDATEFCNEMSDKYPQNKPLFIQCDITDTEDLRASIAEASQRHGAVRVLVNNAANDKRHSTEEVTPEFWDQMLAVNLKAYFFACQAVIAGMRENGGGAIVNFSSISYMMGNSGYPAYTTSNAGITGMTRSLAREFGPDMIRVNALAPGWVLTQRQKDLWVTPEALEAHLERQCIKQALEPQDIVEATLFLSSRASRMMTGQTIAVDGGVVVSG
ncbi:SDR family NAD(P)-dependent oxidoreductase [Pseudochrobactrum sp. MP213Fo]|uniref:SDR family NAD(P)-dependent oxidoreductase n=1 Tax=Pseudochrobactrum sp. MP213Fo TaxID=3022250 RepID=UPI003BA342F2